MPPLSLDEWFASGERIAVTLPALTEDGETRIVHIFCRLEGAGPWLTFLHGFPTCSWDWAKVAPLIKDRFRLLTFDFLGYGDSDKPANHRYSLFEQASLTEAVWHHYGVERTGLVAHNYGSTVAVELLSRLAENSLTCHLEGVLLMNAGLYVDLQRPVLAQRLLQKPVVGPLLNRFIRERFFRQQFSSIFSPEHPISPDELHQHWRAIIRRNGVHNYHRLIYYLTERRLNKARWEGTLENPPVPVRFLWGLEDPVSGRHISAHIRQHIPDARLRELPGIGHYPQLEAPELVAGEIAAAFAS
jgi:pimeloyl-ACP methyl ester carboxylesterase